MKDYIFIFGRDPDLSLLEFKAYFESREIKYKIKKSFDLGIIVQLDDLNFSQIINDLGGTLKIAEVVNVEDYIFYNGKSNKVRYGISYYHSDLDLQDVVKKKLKKEKLKVSIKKPGKKERFLSPTESVKLFKIGFEIVVLGDFVGNLIAVYNPKEYVYRDKMRPAQRPLHMISIRLAKILINLTGIKKGETLLDPFCGIGVLLQEALLMNLNVVGVDVDGKCVNDSLKNLKWLKKEYNTQGKFKVIKGDSRNLSRYLNKVDVVATEPYMGPFHKKLPTAKKAKEIVTKLTPMYLQLLKGFKKIVRKRIVIVIPRFRLHDGKRIKINFKKLLDETGFKPVKDCPIIYEAVKSKIEREIWIIN